jgi:uncharacterized membrane protein
MSTLIALTYDDEQTGRTVFEKLAELQKQQLLQLEDAALAIKDQKGKVKVKQTLENQVTGSAALWGGFWGLLIGLLFLAPIFWGLFGALMGFIAGKAGDIGIDNKFIKNVGDSLEPGGAAVFMLVIQATTDKVLDELSQYGGHVFQTSLSKEDEQKLKDALSHEKVKESADETLDLEGAEAASA